MGVTAGAARPAVVAPAHADRTARYPCADVTQGARSTASDPQARQSATPGRAPPAPRRGRIDELGAAALSAALAKPAACCVPRQNAAVITGARKQESTHPAPGSPPNPSVNTYGAACRQPGRAAAYAALQGFGCRPAPRACRPSAQGYPDRTIRPRAARRNRGGKVSRPERASATGTDEPQSAPLQIIPPRNKRSPSGFLLHRAQSGANHAFHERRKNPYPCHRRL